MPPPKALAQRPRVSKTVPVPTQERPEAHGSVRPQFPPSNAAVTAALSGGRGPAALPHSSARLPPAGQDTVGNGAVAAAGRTEPGPRQPPTAEPAPAEAVEATPAASGAAAETAARPGPAADPKFATLKKDVGRKKRSVASSHPPPRTEAGAAQDAARPPKDDEEAQGKTANAEKMNEAKPKDFDKDAFIRAVEKAIAEKAPKNLDEADKFADSGKADEVRAEVHGKVGEGKADSAEQIATTTAAPPDSSAAVPKKVVPLTSDRPPGAPGTPNPANAVPDELPPSATDLSAGPAQLKRRMAGAQVTEAQLQKSNEPTFKNALSEKKAAERHSEAAPGRMRGHEKKELTAATAQAKRLGAAAMGAMGAQRARTGQQVDRGKGGAKGRDEEKRAQVTTLLQGVFDTMKKDVEAILDGLDKLVDDQFGRGEKAARDAFTAEHQRKMDEYKDRRYSGVTGKLRWVRDKFAGLPAEADKIFEEARDNYVRRMRQVISDVADTVGTELNRAKHRIARGRAELQAAVRKLPADLRSIGQQAAAEFTDKFDELTQSVDDKGTQLVDTLATKYTDALKSVDDEIAAEKEKNKGLVAKAVDAVKSVINTILELKRLLLSVLAKAASAVMLILKDPIGFLRNLVSAVGAGLRQFLRNIGRHLQQGILSWLLGRTAEAGIELPAKFDTQGVLKMLASLLGLTWQNIRSRIVRKVPKMEPAVAAAETAVPLVAEVRKRGVAGMWDDLKTRVGDLKKDLLDKVIAYVTPTIVVAGIMWVISLLNPASAFVRAVKLIIDIVRFVVTQARQIFEFVNAVLDAVIAIARGGSGGVPGLIEQSLARSIPVLLGVLAAILGVGGIASRVKGIVQAMSKPVGRAVDWVVDKIVGLVKKVWAKIKPRFDKKKPKPKPKPRPDRKRPGSPRRRKRPDQRRRPDRRRPKRRGDPKKRRPDKRTEAAKKRALDAAIRDATRLLNEESATVKSVRRGLPAIKRRHRLTRIRLKKVTKENYRIEVAINPEAETQPENLGFRYKIAGATSAAAIEIIPVGNPVDRLLPIPHPMKEPHPAGFVITMAAIPSEVAGNPQIAARYLTDAWAGSTEQQVAAARTAVIIGVNAAEPLDPAATPKRGAEPVRKAVHSIAAPNELRMLAFGFLWTPTWVDTETGKKVAFSKVRKAYVALAASPDQQKAARTAEDEGLRDRATKAIPYGLVRGHIFVSHVNRAKSLLAQVNRQVYGLSQDADGGLRTLGGKGLLAEYDAILRDIAGDATMITGGYHFEGFDWGSNASPRTVQLTQLANEIDRAIRAAFGLHVPQALYPAEPNTLIKLWDARDEKRVYDIFQRLQQATARDRRPYGVGGGEGRRFRNWARRLLGGAFSMVYAPSAAIPSDPRLGTDRGFEVSEKSIEDSQHPANPVIKQAQSMANAYTITLELTGGMVPGLGRPEQTTVSRVFRHVEAVIRLLTDAPELTMEDPGIQEHVDAVKTLLKDARKRLLQAGGSIPDAQRTHDAMGLVESVAHEIIGALTASDLKRTWRKLNKLTQEIRAEKAERKSQAKGTG
ncbi:phage tail protein [Streptomyces yatensis]|uniref:HPC2 multi-domain protein n=1 Tax=Streptomyces yatensis TaxID=155177 RepID=A0ABN2HXS7_9ACTN|nr:hypothetical protein [Streptomyces yatensis]